MSDRTLPKSNFLWVYSLDWVGQLAPEYPNAAFVFFTRDKTLHTRFFSITDDGPKLLKKVNSTPRYLSSQNGYKALELLPADSQPVVYLKMVDPSEANRARRGKEGDFLMKVNDYLEANKK